MNEQIDLKKGYEDLEEKTRDLNWKLEGVTDNFENQIRKITDHIVIWNKLSEYTIPFSYKEKINKINTFLDSTDYPDIVNTYRIDSKWKSDLPYTYSGFSGFALKIL